MKKTKILVLSFLFVVCFSGCSLFSSGGGRATPSGDMSTSSGNCPAGQTATVVSGTTVCVSTETSSCSNDSDCGTTDYCQKVTPPYQCVSQPCMSNTDCTSSEIWGTMTCNLTASPHQCVNINGDTCQRGSCGFAQYCDVFNSHPYSCKSQACTGSGGCPPAGANYHYICNMGSRTGINFCQQIFNTQPTACTSDAQCLAPGPLHCNTTTGTCECNNTSECPSATPFCRAQYKTCEAPPQSACTSDQLCNDTFSGCNGSVCDYFCDTRPPNICRLKMTSDPASVCKRNEDCVNGWCYDSQTIDPLAGPPASLTELGYCKDKGNGGALDLPSNAHCIDSTQCFSQVCEPDFKNDGTLAKTSYSTCGMRSGHFCTGYGNNCADSCKSGAVTGYESGLGCIFGQNSQHQCLVVCAQFDGAVCVNEFQTDLTQIVPCLIPISGGHSCSANFITVPGGSPYKNPNLNAIGTCGY